MRIGIIPLGCDKNTVDMEYLAGVLAERGHTVLSRGALEDMDVLVLHTCGFIADARDQSFDTIASALEAKRALGNPARVVVSGCLSQRGAAELERDYPGIDAIAGVGGMDRLADRIEALASGADPREAIAAPDMAVPSPLPRRALAPAPYAYLRIADGCNHRCAFCAIPAIKGPYRSVDREILLGEARGLLRRGAREINLIAQDLAPYGRDLYGADYGLPDLLQNLCAIDGHFRLRLLYLYPAGITDRFLDVFAREDKIAKYLDVPLQHLDPGVLKKMGRPGGEVDPARVVARIREAVPETAIRTTMILGHPGESKTAFRNLIKGIAELRFDRLGAFAFSPEEDTPAALMPEQVAPKTAERRVERLMTEQAEISAEIQEGLIGRELEVLVEAIAEDGSRAEGRTYRSAPEVDGVTVILPSGNGPPLDRILTPGDFEAVRIVDADAYDLAGVLVDD